MKYIFISTNIPLTLNNTVLFFIKTTPHFLNEHAQNIKMKIILVLFCTVFSFPDILFIRKKTHT